MAFSVGCRPSEGPPPAPGELDALPDGKPATGLPDSAGLPGESLVAPAGVPDGRAVLNDMVAAYKAAASYGDQGYVEVRHSELGPPEQFDYLVAMVRPNKVRIQAYDGIVASDGEKLRAMIRSASGRMLEQDAPRELSPAAIYTDFHLLDALAMGPTQTFSWMPIQLILLLADDPLKTLLYECQEPVSIEPAAIDNRLCHRVVARRPSGTCVFWIDQETSVLRRFEFPADLFRMMLAQGSQIPPEQLQDLAIVAEFKNAELDGVIDAVAFAFEAPPDTRVTDDYMGGDLLGQPAPEFSVVDLEGNAVTRDALAGKVAVIDFWATWCGPCRQTLPELETVYQKYQENDKVAFLAVSIDEPDVDDPQVQATFDDLKVTVPIARDKPKEAASAFRVESIPCLFLIGSDGTVEFQKIGGAPPGAAAEELTDKIEKLLAGTSVYEDALAQLRRAYETQQKWFAEFVDMCVSQGLFLSPGMMQSAMRRAEILPRSEPASLRLTPLWNCTELAQPGNILVVERAEGPPRILVLEQASSIAEIAPAGNVVSLRPLGAPQNEPVMVLRTAVGEDGARLFAGSATGALRAHLWDDDFKLRFSFPPDATENRHPGIADVRLADLDGDGTLEMALSYFGEVGVQGVSLEGKRVWANRSVVGSLRIAVLAPDDQGKAGLLCMESPEGMAERLVILDGQGERQGEVIVPNRAFVWIEAADLDGDGRPELCGFCPSQQMHLDAVGFDLDGKELWSHPMPRGMHQHQVEAITPGRLLADQPGQWLLAGADGSIRIVDADGKLIDSFAYGATLTGLATASWDGKQVLLVATTNGVDAWQVEPSAQP
jgi:thiol-disulfide isomerase/thioredoxin